jgi:hypothetical protein
MCGAWQKALRAHCQHVTDDTMLRVTVVLQGADEPVTTKPKATPALINGSNSSNPVAASSSSGLLCNMLNGSSSCSAAAASSVPGVLQGHSSSSGHMPSGTIILGPSGAGKPGLLGNSSFISMNLAAMPAASSMARLPTGTSSSGGLPSGAPPLGPMPGQLGTLPGLAQGGSSQQVPRSSAGLPRKTAASNSRRRSNKNFYHKKEYEVERILEHSGELEDGTREYLVKWLGYGAEDNTWQSAADCNNCPEAVKEYWDSVRAAEASAASSPAVPGSPPGVPQGSSAGAVPGAFPGHASCQPPPQPSSGLAVSAGMGSLEQQQQQLPDLPCSSSPAAHLPGPVHLPGVETGSEDPLLLLLALADAAEAMQVDDGEPLPAAHTGLGELPAAAAAVDLGDAAPVAVVPEAAGAAAGFAAGAAAFGNLPC